MTEQELEPIRCAHCRMSADDMYIPSLRGNYVNERPAGVVCCAGPE